MMIEPKNVLIVIPKSFLELQSQTGVTVLDLISNFTCSLSCTTSLFS
jgi:hypothetical protein